MSEIFTDKAGKQRLGIRVACCHCGGSFVSRQDCLQQFCYRSCATAARVTRVKVICAWCKKQFSKPRCKLKSKSGLVFCSRKCKDAAQQLGGLRAIMPAHYGTAASGNIAYRRLCKLKAVNGKLSCLRCDYDEFECGIDVHHVDGNHDNNDTDNLIALCAPCHRALEQGLWHLEELTRLDKLKLGKSTSH